MPLVPFGHENTLLRKQHYLLMAEELQPNSGRTSSIPRVSGGPEGDEGPSWTREVSGYHASRDGFQSKRA